MRPEDSGANQWHQTVGAEVEDLALAAYALNQLVNQVDEEIVLRHWRGSGDLLRRVKQILETADEMVGSGLWNKLRALVGSK